MVCKRFFVTGRVQGVWFRAATQEQAQAFKLTGYARNLDDGRVEVLACGEEADVVKLQQWLWQGPPLAQVTAVEPESTDFQQLRDFSIR